MGIFKLNPNYRSKLKLKTFLSMGIVLVILICVYVGIFHSHRYYGFDIVLWLTITGLVSIIVLDLIWFDDGKWHKLRSFLFILLVGGPATATVIFLHSVYVDKQLIGHEITANGVVTELYTRKNKNSKTLYAVFSYQVNGKTWTQDMINNDYALDIGDTVRLVCSKLDPEIFIRLNN